MKHFLIALIILVFTNCSSDPKTDSELLEKDRTDLAEHLQSFKVTTYKFGKIVIRSSAEKDTLSPEFIKFKSDFDRINKLMNSVFKDKRRWCCA